MQPPFADSGAVWQQVEAVVSAERLRPYRGARNVDELDPLARSLWNVALSEALYPSLHGFEIALRNTIHNAMAARTHNTSWWDDPTVRLHLSEQERIREARDALARAGKAYESGRMVAELRLGFWVSLFSRHYEHSLLIPILRLAFPAMRAGQRTRQVLAARFGGIRELRNRAFHHEPVWKYRDLGQRHLDILEAIGWISPVKQALVAAIDRFDSILAAGWQPYRAAIENRLLGTAAP